MKKKYHNPINIPIFGHKLIVCPYSLRIDTYSSCFHECLYCYGRSILSSVNSWTPKDVKVAQIEDIKKEMKSYFACENAGKNSIASAFQNKVPIRIGGQTDCFQPAEEKYEVTKKLLEYLNAIDYPYLIVTKSNLIAEPDYKSLLRRDLAYVQITITTLHKDTAESLETRAPSPQARIETIKNLNEAGIFTAGRISPIIPNISEEDAFWLIDELEKIRTPHLVFELFRGSQDMIDEVEAAVGKNVFPMEKKGFYFRLPSKKKNELYNSISEAMSGRKMTFTFCSDGTPVPFDLHSCKNCCGLESLIKNVPETKFNCGNEKAAPYIYDKLKEKGEVKRSDFDDYFTFSEKKFRKCWYKGELANYLPNCRWDKKRKKYYLASTKDS